MLGTTVRTLQAQLKESGLSFSEMLEAQRIELAKRQLRLGGTSVHEIAVMLGYSEQATFGRAFKRWTGVSPRAFRQVDQPPLLPPRAAGREPWRGHGRKAAG